MIYASVMKVARFKIFDLENEYLAAKVAVFIFFCNKMIKSYKG